MRLLLFILTPIIVITRRIAGKTWSRYGCQDIEISEFMDKRHLFDFQEFLGTCVKIWLQLDFLRKFEEGWRANFSDIIAGILFNIRCMGELKYFQIALSKKRNRAKTAVNLKLHSIINTKL